MPTEFDTSKQTRWRLGKIGLELLFVVNAVKKLYQERMAKVKTTNIITEDSPCHKEKTFKQECSMSPTLFKVLQRSGNSSMQKWGYW